MANTKKAFNELTEAGKKARIEKYRANDAKYGIKEGLFRVTNVAHHADKTVTNNKGEQNTVASFGYNVVPVKGVDTKDFTPNQFAWVNQLINHGKGDAVIEAMDQLKADLTALKADKSTKANSILVSIKYKVNAKGYINVNSLYRRDAKPAQATQATQPADASEDNLNF